MPTLITFYSLSKNKTIEEVPDPLHWHSSLILSRLHRSNIVCNLFVQKPLPLGGVICSVQVFFSNSVWYVSFDSFSMMSFVFTCSNFCILHLSVMIIDLRFAQYNSHVQGLQIWRYNLFHFYFYYVQGFFATCDSLFAFADSRFQSSENGLPYCLWVCFYFI